MDEVEKGLIKAIILNIKKANVVLIDSTKEVCDLFKSFECINLLTIIDTSEEKSHDIPNKSIDFLYINSNENLLEIILNVYYSKVKNYGYLIGNGTLKNITNSIYEKFIKQNLLSGNVYYNNFLIKNVLEDNQIDNDINKENIIFVTAFKDIGRINWKNYQRSNDDYFNNFYNLAKNINYTLVVYLETDIINEVKKRYSFNNNIIFKEFNEVEEIFFNKYMGAEKKIMSSSIYQRKIPPSRKFKNPEHIYPDYTLINHSKINFLTHAKKNNPNYMFYAWIDFGYLRDINNIPKDIDVSKLPKKIIYHALKTPPKNRISPNEMLASEEVYLTGSSYIVHNSLVEKFNLIYEYKILKWQLNYIADDDQNLVLQIYFDNPELFHLIQFEEWFSLYRLIKQK
jgi:hypothetical protein